MSTQEECCIAAVAVPGMLKACVKALSFQADRPGVVVRLAYALGNMMATSEEARWQVFSTINDDIKNNYAVSKYLAFD